MKRRGIIIGVAAIVVLAAGIVAVNRIDTNKAAPKPAESAAREYTKVLSVDDASEIQLEADGTELRFINTDGVWSIDGLSDTSEQKINMFVSEATGYSTISVLGDSRPEYGLESPAAVIRIKSGDVEHVVKIGAKSAVEDAYFADADGTLFLLGSSQYETLTCPAEYYTEFTRFGVDTDTIDRIRIAQPERAIELYIPEIRWMENNVWRMKSPYEVLASDVYIDEHILPQLEALTLSQKADTLGAERARLAFTSGGREYELIIGSTADGRTAVSYDGAVYYEPAELFAFLDDETYSYMSKLVSYVNINEVDRYTVEYGNETHTVEISGDDKAEFSADGVKKDKDSSKAVYIELIGVISTGLYDSGDLGEQLLAVTFEGERTIRIEYRRLTEYSAAVVINGTPVYVTGTADVGAVTEKLKLYFGG